ncbi:MAG: transglutaminase-like domain-containing protein, partial [Planctomycetota bacterium]
QRREGAFENSALRGYDLTGTSRWSPVTVRVTPDEATKVVHVGVLAGGTGSILVHSIHARAPKATATPTPTRKPRPAKPKLGPGLYRAEGRYIVLSSTDDSSVRTYIPVPILWRDQVPIDFSAWTEPAGHVKSVKLRRTEHGFHYAQVTLAKLPRGNSVRFNWAGHVLVLPHRPSPIPTGVDLPLTKVPDDVKSWLAPTWCCDTTDPEIRKVAQEIRKAGKTADVVVPATLARMREIYRAAKGRVSNLTASEALTKRGSCTSCANLGAALFRAHGIPARIIAGYPTWSGPLQTHYVVEYWLPKGGWRLMESTMCRDDRPGWEQIEVAMVRIEDEAKAVAGRRFSAAGGVPWLSLTEYPDARGKPFGPVRLMGDMPDKRACDHRAVVVAVFPERSDEVWAEAAAKLAARWRARTAKAATSSSTVKGLAPRPGTEEAGNLEALLSALE